MTELKPDYKNWIPKGMIASFAAGAAVSAAAYAGVSLLMNDEQKALKSGLKILSAAAGIGCAAAAGWCLYGYHQFSYDGKRKLSKQIIEGTASYVNIPEGGKGLDVGCGSGALTIACAKRNPHAKMIGIDPWGPVYASFNKERCEANAKAEGVTNTEFKKGNAIALDFPDESFDAVVSNYVYHNISGHNKQKLLKESLRVLKKGGTFAIHDIMSRERYGDMEKFVNELKDEGYVDVQLIRTDRGLFMSKAEALCMFLTGSTLLTGKK